MQTLAERSGLLLLQAGRGVRSLYRRATEGAPRASVRAVVRHDGRVLKVRQTLVPWVWTLPGGEAERGESPEACAVREVMEETGVEMRNPQIEVSHLPDEPDAFVVSGTAASPVIHITRKHEICDAAWFAEGD